MVSDPEPLPEDGHRRVWGDIGGGRISYRCSCGREWPHYDPPATTEALLDEARKYVNMPYVNKNVPLFVMVQALIDTVENLQAELDSRDTE